MPRWEEPSRGLRLLWGRYADRYGWGLVLVAGGLVHLQGSNPDRLLYLLVGTSALVIGFGIMPATGWRRIAAAGLGLFAQWLLITGPQSMWVLTALVLAWLVVRHRPLRAYVVLVIPVVYGVVAPPLFEEYRRMPVALSIGIAGVVASAWLARAIAARPWRRRMSADSAAIPQPAEPAAQ